MKVKLTRYKVKSVFYTKEINANSKRVAISIFKNKLGAKLLSGERILIWIL